MFRATRSSPPPRFDVVGVGESMLTLYRDPNGSDSFAWDVGGAESNVTRNCAALGLNSAWISRLGTGMAGSLVHDVITASGVDTSLVAFCAESPTGLMLREPPGREPRVQYYRRGSAASQMSPPSVPVDACLDSKIVHMTGITLALSDGCRDLVRFVLSTPSDALRSFDVNWRPALWSETPRDLLLEVANLADIVFVGLDEAREIWGVSDPHEVQEILIQPTCLVVKDGANGVHTFMQGTARFEPALRGPTVDAMGAGDAFAAGFLCGLLARPDDLRSCQRLGHIVAMSALTSETDVGRPPEWPEIERMLAADAEQWRTITYPDPPFIAPQEAEPT